MKEDEIINTKVLVIDDNRDDGIKITETLWKLGLSVLFVEYSEDKIMNGLYGKHFGVRAVFLDIDLRAAGLKASIDFSPALAVIDNLLVDDNGPWALITYTQFDDQAKSLFDYLNSRLDAIGKKPISLDKIDKERLIVPSKKINIKKLNDRVNEILTQHSALTCLTKWECFIHNASSSVINDLGIEARNEAVKKFNAKLDHLLWNLASADAGKTLTKDDDISSNLYSVLTPLLVDKLCNIKTSSYTISENSWRTINEQEIDKWRYRINGMIHYDSNEKEEMKPGSLFEYPIGNGEISIIKINNSDEKNKLIRSTFLNIVEGSEGYNRREEISDQCDLLLMDITPSCDHAQKKILWRRFMVICKVPLSYRNYLYHWNNDQEKREEGKLKGDYLKMSPIMIKDNDEFVLVFNANLQVSIEENKVQSILKKSKGRIREQLLSDVMHWLGHHITRSGYVSL